MPIPSIIAGIVGQIARFWEKSLIFFAAVAICCFLLSGASLVFIYLGFRDVGTSWVVWFFFGGIVAAVLAIGRSIEELRNRPFLLIADKESSFFHLAPRAGGNPGKHTQLSLHFRATNNRGGPLLLSAAKLIRPWPRGAKVQIQLATHNAMRGNYSSDHFIHARSTAMATAQIILHRDVGDKKALTVVLEVSDQRGSKQRVKFKGLEQN